MRPFAPLAAVLLALPLAACFDSEISVNFTDADTVEATVIRTASAEFFEIPNIAADYFCQEGIEARADDGSRTCISSHTGTIDEVVNAPEIGDSISIERREGGILSVSLDLTRITSNIVPPGEAGNEQMLAMMAPKLAGHAITLHVGGREILATNGIVTQGGKVATFDIPLDAFVTGTLVLPPSFDVLLLPGT